MVGRAEGLDRRQMLGASISAVPVPPVPRIPARQSAHEPVAHGLRDDAGRGDRVTVGITIHEGIVGVADFRHRQSVEEQAGKRGGGEAGKHAADGPLHCEGSGDTDIEVVDLPDRGPADADRERSLANLERERFPACRREGLAVAHSDDHS